jgi:hypothetical protein
MSQELCYFIATGSVLDAIKAYHAAAKAHLDYMQALGNEIGLPRMWTSEERVVGFSGSGSDFPPFMRRATNLGNKDILIPNSRTSEGRALVAKMKAAPPAPSREQVMRAAGLSTTLYFENGRGFLTTCGWEIYGETTIFILRADDGGEPRTGNPRDCEWIPTSRYWLLREAHATSTAANTPA